jgi:chromate transporter
MVLLKLFFSFFKISLFAVGGAYSFLPLVESEVVQHHQWLDRSEFLEVVGIVKVFPGAISINFATYTGYKVAGIPGVIVANAANMLPPVLLILFAARLYLKYKDIPAVRSAFTMAQYAVFAMILAVAIQLVNKSQLLEFKHLAVVAAAFSLFLFTRIHPVFVIFAAAAFGVLLR